MAISDKAATRPVRWISAVLLLLLILFGAYYFWQLSGIVAHRSDDASILLMADDMRHGNWLLGGWTVAHESYWLTDGLVALGLVSARGLDQALLYAVPVTIYLAVVVLVVLASGAGLPNGPPRRIAMGIAVLPMLLVTQPLASVVFAAGFHTSTVGVVLGAVLALYFGRRGSTGRTGRIALAGAAFVLLAAGEFSEPYTTVLGVAPIMITSLWILADAPELGPWLGRLWPAVVAAGAWLVAHTVLGLVAHVGGPSIIPFSHWLISFPELGTSVLNMVWAFLTLSGADFFGQHVDLHLIAPLARLAYLMGGVYAVCSVLRQKPLRQDWLGSTLSIAALLSVVGNLLGTSNVDPRYRMPPLILMGVVLARYVATVGRRWIEHNELLAGGIMVTVVLAFAWMPPAYLPGFAAVRTPPDFPRLVLGEWLEQHGLTYGYGGFWESSIVTVETRGKVKIRGVISTKVLGPATQQTGLPPELWRIVPWHIMSKSDWYVVNAGAKFLVFDPSSDWDRGTGVTLQSAINTFGSPNGMYTVGPYQILTWDRGLRFGGVQSALQTIQHLPGVLAVRRNGFVQGQEGLLVVVKDEARSWRSNRRILDLRLIAALFIEGRLDDGVRMPTEVTVLLVDQSNRPIIACGKVFHAGSCGMADLFGSN